MAFLTTCRLSKKIEEESFELSTHVRSVESGNKPLQGELLMHIANPIYDVVFKYLMEDAKVAKLLISSIIGEEIEELDFRPQEFTTDIDKSRIEGRIGTLTVYRLDFTAKISTKEGSLGKEVLYIRAQ